MGTSNQIKKIVDIFANEPTDRLQAILESGLLSDVRDANFCGLDRNAARMSMGLVPMGKSAISKIAVVSLPRLPAFVAADHFKVDTRKKSKVRIAHLLADFKDRFLVKGVDPVDESTISVMRLVKNLTTPEILSILPREKVEIHLSQFWAILERYAHDESGILTTDGRGVLAFVRGAWGNRWLVFALWDNHHKGWTVGCKDETLPDTWFIGARILLPS